MKETVYVDQLADLKSLVDGQLTHPETINLETIKALSGAFMIAHTALNSVEEKALSKWLYGVSGDLLYDGGVYWQNTAPYLELLVDISDTLKNILPNENPAKSPKSKENDLS